MKFFFVFGKSLPLFPEWLRAQSFVLAAFATLVCQRNCVFLCKGTKLKIVMPVLCRFSLLRLETPILSTALCKSSRIRRKPNSGDSLPVFALECFYAFDTGGLGLWLGAFGRSRLYRCQSVPGPLCRFFVEQSFVLAAFATLVCQRNCVFLCKGTKLKIVMPAFCGTELCFRRLCNFDLPNKQRFSLQRHKAPEFGEAEFWDCTPVSCFTNALCQNSR